MLECEFPEILQHLDAVLRRYALWVKLCEQFKERDASGTALCKPRHSITTTSSMGQPDSVAIPALQL